MLTKRLGKQLTLIFCFSMTLQVKVSQGRRNIKSGLSGGNVIVTVFWDEKGILMNVLPEGGGEGSSELWPLCLNAKSLIAYFC